MAQLYGTVATVRRRPNAARYDRRRVTPNAHEGTEDMSKASEAELIDLVENRYFASVDGKNLDGTLDCFAPDATLRVETAKVEHAGHDAIGRMFDEFMGVTKTIYHGGFSHVTVYMSDENPLV